MTPYLTAIAGLVLGGGAVWLWMRERLFSTRRRLHHFQDEADRLFFARDDHETALDSERFAAANERRLRAEAEAAHTRVTDALEAQKGRIERALEQETPGANATVKRVMAILRGER